VINKTITLIGINHPVIDGLGTGATIRVSAPNVTLQDLTMVNSGHDLNTGDAMILIEGNGARVLNCDLRASGFGIYLRSVNRCSVRKNKIQGDLTLHASNRGNGIHLWKAKDNDLVENRITGMRDGIYFSYADSNHISGNVISNTRFGIHYMYSHYNTLTSNILSGNAVGATLMFSRHSLIQGNIATGNMRHGMLLKQLDNSYVIGNIVSGQNRGLFIQQAAMNRFENNVIATNDIGIYLSSGSEQNVFVGNAFLANVDQIWQPPFEKESGLASGNVFYEKGRGNYWSDYSGSDAHGDGIGDTPYHETDVYGYLVDRYRDARVFALSPAVGLLRKSEELLPVVNLPGVVDLYPMMHPAKGIPAQPVSNESSHLSEHTKELWGD
jgi:nitrous oxidase accessory protein